MTRGSVRLRLTVLFASLFLAAGAGLLGITYGLVSHATNGIIVARFNGATIVGSPGSAGNEMTVPGLTGGLPLPGTLNAATTQYASDTRSAENEALLLYFGHRARHHAGDLRGARLVRGRAGAAPAAQDHHGGQADLGDEPA